MHQFGDNRSDMAPRRLEVLVESPLSSVATLGEVVITIVHTAMTEEALRAASAASHRLAVTYPAGVSGIAIVKQGVMLPDTALRKMANDAMLATERHTRCTARVFLGDGFWLSTMRSVLTAIELIRPYDQVRRTFGDVQQATRWMATTTAQDGAWAERLCEATLRVAGLPVDARLRAP
jgi:hypothetical protein